MSRNQLGLLFGLLSMAIGSVATVIATAGLTLADYDCTLSGVVVPSNTTMTLSQNYYCTGYSCTCFSVQSGATLELDGHSITCQATPPAACVNAISASTGAKIYGCKASGACSNGTTVGGVITSLPQKATWYYGVFGGDTVQDVTIQGASVAGASVVKNVLNNVFQNCALGIQLYPGGSQGGARNNFVDGNAPGIIGNPANSYTGIYVLADVAIANLDHNFIRGYRGQGLYFAAGPYSIGASDNIIGQGNPAYSGVPVVQESGALVTYARNICTNSTKCPRPTHIFSLP
jgi:hypothetical protein